MNRTAKAAAGKPAGKGAAKKAPSKSANAKKTSAMGTAAKKGPSKSTSAASTAPKKTASKKSAPNKTSSKKSPPNKAAPNKTAPNKTTPKKTASKKTSPAAKRAAALDAALSAQRLPLGWRVLILLVSFVAMVGFAVVLSKLTLNPSAASESLVHSNLRPGDSIRDYLAQPAIRDTIKQLGGNIVLGMPFGVLLPALVPRTRGLLRVMAATAVVMLLVELVQGALVQGRAFDIDDVILNTTGAMLGYLILGRSLGLAVHPRRRHWWHCSAVSGSRGRP